MIILGLILAICGYAFGVSILITIGIILVVVGAVLWAVGTIGHKPVAGRKHWY